jgi:hypothetical protein
MIVSLFGQFFRLDKPAGLRFERPRDCRRPFGLSYAAMEATSSMAYYRSSASTGGMLPIGASSRRLLNMG